MTINPGWRGSLKLVYGSVNHTTHVAFAQAQAPLKVQRSLYPEGQSVCHSIILHTAGGIVGGDRLALDIQLQPQANALITTASAGKIYRTSGLEANQTTHVNVATGACLEWLPQEMIVFDQARYRQAMRIELAPGATWLGWEMTRFGRSARNEQFLQGDWRSQTEIWQEGRPLWIDRQWLPGSEVSFYGNHGLAGCPVVGSFAFVGQPVDTKLVEQARLLWAGAGEGGVTRLQSGLLCRYRGHSTADVRQWFVEVWRLIRLSFLGRSGCVPRVWGVL
ncbi:urease accessory protein UreD [Leptolyngbya sp. FACHB-321]|uniref:urease accessory protein UreD n=1 Tax=Leptolyngbya sp. FACHB-321 TaxID=2692807 RepID=UPI0016881BEA|nr:urease accessory protein UreD [Leptolyngbya sp. FACHB-321]MBD2037526.1 urease accessory protein UreD [Leptolyngbya sp. FACHB-321]